MTFYRCCGCCRTGHGLYLPRDQHTRPCKNRYCAEGKQPARQETREPAHT